jgi:lipid II:glycine glycyltransferase (peptidoglycan interpeptide bridge formation enzyme)
MAQNTIITDSSKLSREDWSTFVLSHPRGNIFQTPEMFDVYSKTRNFEPRVVVKRNAQTGRIEALMLAPIISEKGGIFKFFTSRVVGYGTPVVDSSDDALQLAREFISGIKYSAIYSSIVNLQESRKLLSKIESIGFEYSDHLNFIFDLTIGEAELWSKISESRRKNIKRASKNGLRVEVSNSAPIDECYKILKETYDRLSLPLLDISIFIGVLNILGPKNYAKFFLAYNDNRLVALRIVLTYKNDIYDWYAGNINDPNLKYSNDLLVWEVMKWGCNNGFKTFNFGGAGKPDEEYGVREFKRTFGGTLVNYGDYKCIHQPLKYILISTGKKYFKTILKSFLR